MYINPFHSDVERRRRVKIFEFYQKNVLQIKKKKKFKFSLSFSIQHEKCNHTNTVEASWSGLI